MKGKRWVDQPATESTPDGRIGSLLRQVPPAAPISRDGLAHVGARLQARSQAARAPRRRWVAVVIFLVFGNAGLVLAARQAARWFSPSGLAAQAPETNDGPAVPLRRRVRRSRPAIVESTPAGQPIVERTPPSVSLTKPPPETRVSRALPVPQPRQVAWVAPKPRSATPRGSLAAEADALGQAIQKLNQGHDPAAALEAFDRYASRFPRGRLQREATVGRVDALLMLGRRARALELLKPLDLDDFGRGEELRVIRAELIAAEDCRSAVTDFDVAVARRLNPALRQRALYGRALCRLRLGDESGGQADLRDYLAQFPEGRFATEARHQLGR